MENGLNMFLKLMSMELYHFVRPADLISKYLGQLHMEELASRRNEQVKSKTWVLGENF